jgi:hypothetical protein
MTDEYTHHDLQLLAIRLFGAPSDPEPEPEPEPRRNYVPREGRTVARPRGDRDMREFTRQLFGDWL